MRAIAARILGLALLFPLAWELSAYPAWRGPLAAATAAYAALLWLRPALWLLVIPALLPVFDLAPWSGWFYVEELDLALLVTASVGYLRWPSAAPESDRLALAPMVKPGLLMAALSAALAAWIGLGPLKNLPAPDASALYDYLGPYNSLRILKGFVWAALLLPLMRRHGAGGQLRRLFVPGMLLGLAGASLAVAWERAVFPGLLNFASDYRPTAPFSAMHTGGAALDAYLAMSFPFVACWLTGRQSHWHMAAAGALLLLGGYAGLGTFSRDVYLAYACSGLVIGGLALLRQRRSGRLDTRRTALAATLIVAAALLLQQVFAGSGYRGLLAALGLLGAGALLAARRQAVAPLPWGALALLLLLLDAGLYWLLHRAALPGTDKGAYLAYALSAGAFALGVLVSRVGGPGRAGTTLALAAFPGLALSAALVANHWGGRAALPGMALLIALAALPPLLRWWRALPLWSLHRHSVGAILSCGVAMAVAIPLSGSYFMSSRFSTVSDDFALRLGHWSEALQMMDDGLATRIFGMGLGAYPATYAWNNHHGERPAAFAYAREDGNTFLKLAPPQYAAGYGEVLRMLQHIDMRSDVPYRLSADIRRHDDNTGLTVAVCERWLLYPEDCAVAPVVLAPGERGWRHVEVPLVAHYPARRWPLRAPTQLEISVDGGRGAIDVDKLRLVDARTGVDLVHNGDFERGGARWFFSSDHNHFPWHVKNFAVDLIFEMGWWGLFSFALLLLPLAVGLTERRLHGEADAGVYLAALVGLMAVGMFDTIIDVPRLTLLFALIVFAAALVPAATPARRRIRTKEHMTKK